MSLSRDAPHPLSEQRLAPDRQAANSRSQVFPEPRGVVPVRSIKFAIQLPLTTPVHLMNCPPPTCCPPPTLRAAVLQCYAEYRACAAISAHGAAERLDGACLQNDWTMLKVLQSKVDVIAARGSAEHQDVKAARGG